MAEYSLNDWRYEVANGDTRLGYAEWVTHKGEADADGDQVEVAEAEPWRVRLTYHVTQYRVAELDVPRSFASDERAAATVAMDMVRTNSALLATEEAEDALCCDVEVDGASWRDECGDFGI